MLPDNDAVFSYLRALPLFHNTLRTSSFFSTLELYVFTSIQCLVETVRKQTTGEGKNPGLGLEEDVREYAHATRTRRIY
jgi:hypothetical protein